MSHYDTFIVRKWWRKRRMNTHNRTWMDRTSRSVTPSPFGTWLFILINDGVWPPDLNRRKEWGDAYASNRRDRRHHDRPT